jgi:SAM-dependent methyltransferase
MFRDSEENDVMSRLLKQRLEGQKKALHLLEEFLIGDKVADLGCGNGAPLKYLAERNYDKLWVGLDHSIDILSKNEANHLDNVILVRGNMTEAVFPEECFDAIVFNKSLHEVFSLYGISGLKVAIETGAKYLRPGGYLMIYENVAEDRSEVTLELLNEESSGLFDRFISDYSIRKIPHRKNGDREVRLRKDDAMEFLTKFREPNWNCEMEEAHFIFTLDEWKRVLEDIGLKQKEICSFDDRHLLSTEGVRAHWKIDDFKYAFIYQRTN